MGRLLDRVTDAARIRGYSANTSRAYRSWIAAFVRFHGLRHPGELGAEAVEGFLASLAREHAAATVNQAHAALVFLYTQVLRAPPEGIEVIPWARGSRRVPTVLGRAEVRRLLAALQPDPRRVASLLYGAGLRVSEGVGLRVKDVDLERSRLIVRQGKGRKDRIAVLPRSFVADLQAHLARTREQHRLDVERGAGWVVLPTSMARKAPTAGRQWPWQWVFPSRRLAWLPDGRRGRYPLHPSTLQKAVARAARRAGIHKRVTPHVLRHSFGTHLVEDGVDVATLQRLMGHADVRTTMLYVHVASDALDRVVSPLDRLPESDEGD